MEVSDVGNMIKAAREKRELSKYKLAKEAGLTAQQLGEIEKGKGLTVKTLLNITNYLGLELSLREKK